jgi:hypothetical protein
MRSHDASTAAFSRDSAGAPSTSRPIAVAATLRRFDRVGEQRFTALLLPIDDGMTQDEFAAVFARESWRTRVTPSTGRSHRFRRSYEKT